MAYENGTKFVHFIAYPFINFLGFSYEMMMVLFSWTGFIGFVYFYMFFKENLRFKHHWQGIDLLTLLMFLPNMHFWTASFGKGSLIFFGLGMATYGISRINKRQISLVLGMALVYHVRPHVFLFMGIGMVVGMVTGRTNTPLYVKILVIAGGVLALFLLYDKILAFANFDSETLIQNFDNFSDRRSGELARSGSGIDTSNYPWFLKLITFWFRPLFFDAPGVLGLIVSVENLFYLILSAELFQSGVLKYLWKSSALVKTNLIIFVATSFALSTTLSNLGIIIRQKSMVMYFFFFAIMAFMDYKKGIQHAKKKKRLVKKVQKKPILLPPFGANTGHPLH